MPEEVFYHDLMARDRLVHIVDADLPTCETLSVVFRLEGFHTAFSINLQGFFTQAERRRPDLVIANVEIGDDSALDLMRRAKVLRLSAPVFVLEDRPMVEAAVRAVKAGALEVFTKPVDSDLMVRAARDALRQFRPIATRLTGTRLTEVRGYAQLTPREREVLELITSGQSNKEAGRELGISPRTIEVHRARVMEKLGARNTADLMRIVFDK